MRFIYGLGLCVCLSACGGGDSDSRDGGPLDAGGTRAAGGASPSGGSATTGGSVSTGPIVHTYAPTFDAVYTEIFSPTCAAAFCHLSDDLGFNAAGRDNAYGSTVSVVSHTELCGSTGLSRVVPGHPEESLLYLKLTDPPCGRKMPLNFSQQLDPRELEQIRLWIANGALRDGPDE
jgi:hypothetical protein